jgi:hypothetical protein
MDLDDELRELFTSDRLDVAVRPDAEQVIVTGARRVRRRRIAAATASGVLGVVIAVAAGFALAGGDPDAMPPATSTTTTRPAGSSPVAAPPLATTTESAPPPVVTTTKTPKRNVPTTTSTTRTGAPRPPVISAMVLGPSGYRELTLGQTLEEAQASGRLGPLVDDSGDCAVYEMKTDVMTSGGRVYVTDTVSAIAPRPAKTPEGVGAGWTAEQVLEVYPDLDERAAASGRALVSVPGNAGASYRLDFVDGKVTGVALLGDAGCAG